MAEGLPTNADLPMDDLMQAAMDGYVEQAMANGHAHDRLVRASYAAAKNVVGQLRDMGLLRFPFARTDAAHGTLGGFNAGCRCEFCREAKSLNQRANFHWKRRQGHNKVQTGAA